MSRLQVFLEVCEGGEERGGSSRMEGLTETAEAQTLESAQRLAAEQHIHESVAILSRQVEQLHGQVVALENGKRAEDNARLRSTDAA